MNSILTMGVQRSPNYFFFELDSVKLDDFNRLRKHAQKWFENYQIFSTAHGYHLVAYDRALESWGSGLYDIVWRSFKRSFKTDFLKCGKYGQPHVLRIAPKFNLKGEEISPRPRLIIYEGFVPPFPDSSKIFYFCRKA